MNVNLDVSASEESDDGNDVFIPQLGSYGVNKVEGLKDGTTSPGGAVFVLINAALGAGLLAFPYAFWSSGGVAVAFILQMILLIFVSGSLLCLAKCADISMTSTFDGMVGELCGRVLGVLSQVCIAVYGFGTNIAFLVVIGDQLVDVSSAFTINSNETLSEQWYFDRKFSISLLSILFIFPFLMLKNIGSLSYTSCLGVVACVYIAIVITVKYFLLRDDDHYFSCPRPAAHLHGCHRSWPDVFNAIPVICFGYQCHASSVPLYAGIRKRSLRRYSVIVAIGMAVCVGVYSLTGAFGYLTFNGRPVCINADILRNYCPRDIPVNVARVMLVLCIITSYPILCFVGRSALDNSVVTALLAFSKISKESLERWQLTRLRIEAVIWFLLSLGLAIFIPDIVKVIQPLGGLAATFIFIFPGCCLLQLLKPPVSYGLPVTVFLYISACILIILGFYILGIAVVYSLMSNTGAIKS